MSGLHGTGRSPAIFLLLALLALLLATTTQHAHAEGVKGQKPAPAVREPLSLLLIQSAGGIEVEGSTLTLKDISPATIFYTDRPKMLQGFLTQDDFVAMWEDGWNRYAADPPNAALQILEPELLPPIGIELMNARFEGSDLIYEFRPLDGVLPAEAGAATLFIDHYIWIPPDRGPQRLGWIRCHPLSDKPLCYSDW